MTKQIPILFSTDMVSSTVDCRKTQTRRTRGLKFMNYNPDDWQFEWGEPMNNIWTFTQKSTVNEQSLRDKTFFQKQVKCPYGKPGDLLWVRETFYRGYILDDNDCIPDNAELNTWFFADTKDARPADMSDEHCFHLWGADKSMWPSWKPSIHMPKEVARIWLEVVKVRVERVQDIGLDDSVNEGIESHFSSLFQEVRYRDYRNNGGEWRSPKSSFMSLWQSINGAESWDENPWVWVVEFKVLSTTGYQNIKLLNTEQQ